MDPRWIVECCCGWRFIGGSRQEVDFAGRDHVIEEYSVNRDHVVAAPERIGGARPN
jgi:hypothetical protein